MDIVNKPHSPDIKRRRSFKKYLKKSPLAKRIPHFDDDNLSDEESQSDGLLVLHPMLTSNNDSS